MVSLTGSQKSSLDSDGKQPCLGKACWSDVCQYTNWCYLVDLHWWKWDWKHWQTGPWEFQLTYSSFRATSSLRSTSIWRFNCCWLDEGKWTLKSLSSSLHSGYIIVHENSVMDVSSGDSASPRRQSSAVCILFGFTKISLWLCTTVLALYHHIGFVLLLVLYCMVLLIKCVQYNV